LTVPENNDQPVETSSHTATLNRELEHITHDTKAADHVRQYLQTNFKNSNARFDFLSSLDVLVRTKISREQAVASQVIEADEPGNFLIQGDIVSTEAAYSLGSRITGSAKFAIANATCDLGAERRNETDCAVVFAIQPIRISDVKANQTINELVSLKSNARMFLPKFSSDEADVLCNYINFASPATIRFSDLLLSTRHASLAKLGWRVFASIHRRWFTREAKNESQMRD
jgi:hypothetical protein